METRKNEVDHGQTALLTMVLLLFFQLLTLWIENIYRLSLIKLSMGKELFGILLFLLPLLLYLLPRRAERIAVSAALITLLAARFAVPFLSAGQTILVAGIGVGSALVVLCGVFARVSIFRNSDLAAATAMAVLLSICFRVWGASVDISLVYWLVGLILVGIAFALWARLVRQSSTSREESPSPPSQFRLIAWVRLVFACFLFIYLVMLSPFAVSAWSETDHSFFIIFIAVFWQIPRLTNYTNRHWLTVGNALFSGLLIIGLLLARQHFPSSPHAPAVVATPPTWLQQLPFYLMYALSTMLLMNLAAVDTVLQPASLRRLVLPVLTGMAMLVIVTLLLIFTNVWGYVDPIGPLLRNQFYLPFLIAGLALTVLPLFLPKGQLRAPSQLWRVWVLGFMLLFSALLAPAFQFPYTWTGENAPSELTVLSYNMQQGSLENGDEAYAEQLEFIRGINADIIGLQESDTARPSGGNVNAPFYFAANLGYHLYYGPPSVAGTFGTAILSRYPLKNPRTLYTYSTVDEVGTAVAEIEVAGRRILLFNCHPAGPDPVSDAQVDALLAEAQGYDHVIALGDFNFRQDEPFYAKLEAAFNNAWTSLYPDAVGPCHPRYCTEPDETLDMTRRIDHIFVSESFDVQEAWYVPAPQSMTDHPAHWAVVRW